jgi:hypothetical protein
MNPDYSKPHKNNTGNNSFINGDKNREIERKDIQQENKNPATYIEKEGKMIPVSLKEYRKNNNTINEEVRRKRQELDDMFRKMWGHDK